MRPSDGPQDPHVAAGLGRFSRAACLVALLAAGPWPGLGPKSLLWRVPLCLAALALAWAGRRPAGPVVVAAALAGLAVAVDGLAPAAVDPARAAAALAQRLGEVTASLAKQAQRSEITALLVGGGGEAQPEELFALAEEVRGRLSCSVDTLMLADDRGMPVAWSASSRRVPVGLRLLGERTLAVETAVDGVWLWWREPVFEGGRPLGALVAGKGFPETGSRRTLGVWAGRAALLRLGVGEGVPVVVPAMVGRLGVEVVPYRPVLWSAPAAAAAVFLLLVLTSRGGGWRVGGAVAAAAAVVAGGWVPPTWWLVVGLALAAWGVGLLPPSGWARALAVALVGVLAWVQTGALSELGVVAPPQRTLVPGLLLMAVAMAWTALLARLPARRPPLPAVAAVLAWGVLGVGAWRADPLLLATGVAAVAVAGLAHRYLAAAAAAVLLLAGVESGQRRVLVGITESVLARRESAARPARALLHGLPEGALATLARLPLEEQVVVLGRLARWLQFERTLPGAALVLTSADGERQGSWGAVPLADAPPPQVLASRSVAPGWRLMVLAPSDPEDVLAALDEGGVGVPVAAFDRGGAPVARGGIFKPLSPTAVGRAMAEAHSWGRVQVGERTFLAYLRAVGEVVLAVPWVRRPLPEWLLLAASLALWGLAPLALWDQRHRLVTWWRERRSFVGRLRFLIAGVTALPVLLLAQALPQQWVRQRELVRLELGRAVSRPLVSLGWEREMAWLVRDLNGVVAVYRGGEVAFCSRPDLLAKGVIPALPPPEAYARAVRGWREPVVMGRHETSVFAPLRAGGEEPLVVGVLGMRVSASGVGPSPAEWFAVLGVWGVVLALVIGEGLGRRLAGPLQRLVEAARALAEGRRVEDFPAARDEDVAALGRGFATMAERVQRREEEVRRQRDLLESVLGALSAAVIVAGEGGEVQLANPAARTLLGGGEDLSHLGERFSIPLEDLVRRALGGEPTSEVVRPPSGRDEAWRLHVLPLLSPPPRRVVLVAEDLSDVARAERLASLAELARIAAHEVKNPLTPIRLWAQELQVALGRGEGAIAEVARLAAEQILERVDHLAEVAQGFSHLVALEHWEPEVVELPRLAREVVGEYAGVLRQRGVEVEVVGEEEGPVLADRRWLARALRHLLDNSTRAMEGVAGTIVVEVASGPDEITLAVRDAGGGVAEEHLGRLFEPHFSTQSQGSGLGLAVVRRVAQRAGGRAEARNTGEGLEVRLVLPRAAGAAMAGSPGALW